MTSDAYGTWDAAYVMGALSPAERRGLVAAAAIASALVLRLTRPSTPPDPPAVRMVSLAGSTDVAAYVSVVPQSWGTHIAVRCTYRGRRPAGPARPASNYQLVLVSERGTDQTLSRWSVRPGVEARPAADTDLPAAQIRYIEIRTAAGVPVLRAAG